MKKLFLVASALLLTFSAADAQTYVGSSSGTKWRLGPKVAYSAVGYICNHKQENFLDAVNVAFMAREVESGLTAEFQYIDMKGRDGGGNLSYLGLLAAVDTREDAAAAGFYYRYGLNFDFLLGANDGAASLRSYYNKFLFGMTFGVGYEGRHLGVIADVKTNLFTNVLKKSARSSNKPDFLPSLTLGVYYLF